MHRVAFHGEAFGGAVLCWRAGFAFGADGVLGCAAGCWGGVAQVVGSGGGGERDLCDCDAAGDGGLAGEVDVGGCACDGRACAHDSAGAGADQPLQSSCVCDGSFDCESV